MSLYFLIELRAQGKKNEQPNLLDLTAFLYDFNMLYEINRLALDPTYEEIQFSDRIYLRYGRPLQDTDRLKVKSLSEKSPLSVELILGITSVILAIPGAIYSTICILEKISDKRNDDDKLIESIKKTNIKEFEQETIEFIKNREHYLSKIKQRYNKYQKAEQYIYHVSERLRKSEFKIEKISIELTENIINRRI
jgi:hypothetical protein